MWGGSEITEDEIGRQIESLKSGKAPGGGGIQNEAWMFGTEGLKERIWEVGQKSDVKNYRGITLLNTAYKIYPIILDERLRKEMEARVGREMRKEGGRMYALFIDLKAAFDSVNREKMWEFLRRKGVDAYLVTKMEEISI
ncbi:uncharacterized protein LOC135138568 [Zophobas morio]|uniref:uncharacterized protein LOC135138568 n=1 Tax=Zophobas morio TaxID=2755281 RepID=UPI003082D1D2